MAAWATSTKHRSVSCDAQRRAEVVASATPSQLCLVAAAVGKATETQSRVGHREVLVGNASPHDVLEVARATGTRQSESESPCVCEGEAREILSPHGDLEAVAIESPPPRVFFLVEAKANESPCVFG